MKYRLFYFILFKVFILNIFQVIAISDMQKTNQEKSIDFLKNKYLNKNKDKKADIFGFNKNDQRKKILAWGESVKNREEKKKNIGVLNTNFKKKKSDKNGSDSSTYPKDIIIPDNNRTFTSRQESSEEEEIENLLNELFDD